MKLTPNLDIICKEPQPAVAFKRQFKLPVGRKSQILRTGPGIIKNASVETEVKAGPTDVVIGWFDFSGKGASNDYLVLSSEDFERNWEVVGAPILTRSNRSTPMIVTHPEFTRDNPHAKHFGFWAAHIDPLQDSYAKRGVLLPWPGDFVDEKFTTKEGFADLVVAYLRDGTVGPYSKGIVKACNHYFGSSFCRFKCGKRLSGCSDMTDGTFVWPEDFHHYVTEHQVKPPQEFLRHVLAGHGIIAGCFGDI